MTSLSHQKETDLKEAGASEKQASMEVVDVFREPKVSCASSAQKMAVIYPAYGEMRVNKKSEYGRIF